jgi:predicted NBD/HSP70 family sugar kinase
VENAEAVGTPTPRGAGRPSVGVRITADGPFVVAVDLGVDRVIVARVGLGGVVLRRAETIFAGSEAWQVGSMVANLVRQVVEDAPPDASLVGIGISVPGMVRRSDGLIRLAPNLDWHDVSFGGIVLAALGVDVPVSLANDADLGALAEHERGAGVGVSDLIYISGNVGVGAGVISGGVRLEGADGYAGEIGHQRFTPANRPCHCGNVGCWETEVGAHAIAQAIRCPTDRVPQLGEVLDGYQEPPRELRAIGTTIGQGLASIINLFNPQLVVLGGYFAALYTLVPHEIDAGVSERTLPAPLESVSLAVPALGRDSVLLGAAEMAFEPLFVDPVSALGSAIQDVRARLAG